MTLYAWLMLGSLIGPLLLSFDKKVEFYKTWPALFAGILVNGIFFIAWDAWFAVNGIWSFNPAYVWDVRIMHLPIEEISFFVVVPYCSVFIYACCKAYFKDDFLKPYVSGLNFFFIGLTGILLLVYHDRDYTFYNCLFAFVLLLVQHILLPMHYMTYFWMAYIIHLIPFLLVNGVLTAKPIVLYNPSEIIGWRIYTIPVEDTIYALTCLLLPIVVYEFLLRKNQVLGDNIDK
ncbi:MAG: lycopene cyclase domain-containing protein [Chitinophagales bacterium]|nr:lycopene cyclase domain-containing protein [Chitinophagales bacterium]